ncbi:MAG: DUF4258 domain-containing protein [Sarcina sp.]
MTINITDVQKAIELDNILYTAHLLERMNERHIAVSDIINCMMNGEIIEQYPDDKPYPSCLIFSYVVDNRPIHVVVALDLENLYLRVITTYQPDELKWINFKERR